MRKRKRLKVQTTLSRRTGSVMFETVAGCFILLPVFLLLIDIIALVLAQSINDDLAKQAARRAGQVVILSDVGTMNSVAQTTAQTYIEEDTSYSNPNKSLACNAEATSAVCTNTATGWQVQVITNVTCYLPVPVPFGGPSSTVFQAQFTAPIVSIPSNLSP